jgi:hypothetical protein
MLPNSKNKKLSSSDNQVKIPKYQVLSKIVIPLIALLFTITYGYLQYRSNLANTKISESLAHSQDKNSKTQSIASLLPNLKNDDPKIRLAATKMILNLDSSLVIPLLDSLAKSDPDRNVRMEAITTMRSFSTGQASMKKDVTLKLIANNEVYDELLKRDLLKLLIDADNYIRIGGSSNKLSALNNYKQVLARLSKESLNKLNQSLLISAHNDLNNKYYDDAVNKYQSLFSGIIKT